MAGLEQRTSLLGELLRRPAGAACIDELDQVRQVIQGSRRTEPARLLEDPAADRAAALEIALLDAGVPSS